MRSFLFVLAAVLPTNVLAETCDDRSQDFEARIALCDQAFEAADTPEAAAQALSLKGEAQRMLGQLDEAAATLQQALGFNAESAWVWVELGNVRYDQGDTAGALAHYSAALAVEDYIDAWANRAESWWQFNNGQRCSDDADNALRLDPQYAYANEIKGRCLIDLGQAEQALSYFDTAISLIPGYQNAYRNKLAALAALGRYEDLVAVADEALRPGVVTDPNPSIEEDILARRLLALGEYAPPATVAAEADALLKRYPQNLAAVNVQGAALLADGKVEEADRVTQVLRQNPDGARMEATYHDTLARIDAAMGRMEDAYANYEAALNLDASLSKTYARKLSELGFLPLSNAPAGVLTALRRCIDVKKTGCVMSH
ncbi:tetratricopeptide repeat protein [Tabrizicola sp.]|jgi:tetratricopeptide (TPR) repeat protein|uniref:tetratricopeptide repeat protein n=1 Tax=Tabrizicola sp. TaxID=2005166 RepID=UPI001A631BD6|nr:tetratricopeptide repeat protein [Tabrizicola sp.]MBL9064150.1 tetratricopeptide repeat protein [Tabrizicola sp.]